MNQSQSPLDQDSLAETALANCFDDTRIGTSSKPDQPYHVTISGPGLYLSVDLTTPADISLLTVALDKVRASVLPQEETTTKDDSGPIDEGGTLLNDRL